VARGKTSDTIGLDGTGADVELTIVCKGIDGPPIETDRAWRLRYEGREFWFPKSAFDDDGMLFMWAVPMLQEKIEEGEE
jgi:hypothetical protein